MLGPRFPVMLDSNGDGQAGVGDERVAPERLGNSITVPTRWACGKSSTNVIDLSNQDSSGRFLTASRNNGFLRQSLTIGAIVNGSPRQFTITESVGETTITTSQVALVDQNGDGVPDGATLTGNRNATTSFAYTSNSDYVSIPWAQASAFGIDASGSCVGALPQVWIPLADTNGDGRGDTVVMDLDNNGRADSDVFAGPVIVVPAVPAMGPVARLILMMLLGLIGAWFLARRRSNNSGTPAAA